MRSSACSKALLVTTDRNGHQRRLLSLSGGGVRGVVAAAFLIQLERTLQMRRGADARLCDHFDLVGGTSTGGLIATAVALGRSAREIADYFLVDAPQLFGRPKHWRFGIAPLFDSAAFEGFVQREVGDLKLAAAELRTLLALTFKRVDTGSPWVVSNIPSAPYFEDPPDGRFVGNKHFRLLDLLMATTSVPGLFEQRSFAVNTDQPAGVFVDGGLAGMGDPSLALLQLARMRAYGLTWPTGPEMLQVISLGTGRFTAVVPQDKAERMGTLRLGLAAVQGLHSDTVEQTRRMMAWLGEPVFPHVFDSEIGDLADDTVGPNPVFRYAHLDVPFETARLRDAGLDVQHQDVARLRSMTNPSIISDLFALATEWCDKHYSLDSLFD